MNSNSPTILIVDDETFVRDALSELISSLGYQVVEAESGLTALQLFRNSAVDIIISDLKMPGMGGIELLKNIRKTDTKIPVILITAYPQIQDTIEALQNGAFDFILKPFKLKYIKATIEKAAHYSTLLRLEVKYKAELEETVERQTRELKKAYSNLKNSSLEIINRLVSVSEYRDTDTGSHIMRIGFISAFLAESLGVDAEFTEKIGLASRMHDIGKVGIPDTILQKEGPLTDIEFQKIQQHTTIGSKMLADSTYPHIQMASRIALHHHECWDGSGYPNGLKGREISLEGRIVMLADQYDALRSNRPYKPPFPHEKTRNIILSGDNKTSPGHFDPDILEVFRKHAEKLKELYENIEY